MKTTNHTPGPWKHDENWGLIKYGKTEICALHSGNEANANLIASAPDLLSALRSLVDLCDKHMPIENLNQIECRKIGAARAAISKAEGNQ